MVWLVFAFAKTYSHIIQIDYNTANCFLITKNTLSCCLIAQQEAERARFLVEKVRGGIGATETNTSETQWQSKCVRFERHEGGEERGLHPLYIKKELIF